MVKEEQILKMGKGDRIPATLMRSSLEWDQTFTFQIMKQITLDYTNI